MVKSVITKKYNKDMDEDRKEKAFQLQEMIQVNKAKKYAWAISHLYPDIYTPQRMPDRYRLPTHIMTNKRQETISIGSTNDFAIYFCPIADCFYNYQFNGTNEIYNGINTSWNASSYISYADNNGQATAGSTSNTKYVFDSNGVFKDVIEWNKAVKGSENLKKFRKIRLLGASLKITYTGKAEDLSGIVKCAMGIKGFTTPLHSENILQEELVNFPKYQTFDLKNSIVCRYRITDYDFTDFGPYTPYSTLPYFLIYGKGLQVGSTIFVEIVKHFEGVVVAEEDEFVSPVRVNNNQASLDEQLRFMEQHKSDGTMEIFSEDDHVNLKQVLE